MYKKVLCGLDIGTNSVGWCLTNENNKIIRKGEHSLWGVRMFEEANDCSKRRSFRSGRRRLHRRKVRIDLLRMLLGEEIAKVDPSFFMRLDSSFYNKSDLEEPFEYTLFNDKKYTDKDYYRDFPTIYHLRQRLIYSDKKEDIRFIYLALHHMIKYRGNFLNQADKFILMDKHDADSYFDIIKSTIMAYEEKTISYNNEIFEKIKDLFLYSKGINYLKEKMQDLINPEKIKYVKDVIIPLIAGGSVSINKLNLDNVDNLDFKSICVKDEKYDDFIAELLSMNSEKEDLITCFRVCKNIYEFFLLGKLLGEERYLSDAMVKRYNEHKYQLDELKEYIKEYYPKKYKLIFKTIGEKINNYPKYIGSNITKNKKITSKHISTDEFYNFIKETLDIKKYKVTEENKNDYLSKITILMNNGDFLPRLNSTDNAIFPYQLNLLEMELILKKQSQFYPFLLEKDDDGLTVIDKIISILKFKIPYYVGPLISPNNTERSKFSWIIRTEEKIYPWNFHKVVNLDETAKNFIYKMLNKCSYLPSNYCLPKNSIIFSYFNVLQVLNKTYLNGGVLTKDIKMDIIHNLFMKRRKVTKKAFKDYFKANYGNDSEITTSNKNDIEEFTADMASYCDFVKIFGKDFVDNNINYIENIIKDIVVFEDKSILEKRLKNEYKIKDSQVIKAIKSLSYSKYSRLSKELLTSIKCVDDNGEVGLSIIRIMEETNQNLQEILYDEKYNFVSIIDTYNRKNSPIDKITKIEDYVKEMGTISPGMKRPLIQAFKICEELEKIVGQPIDEYYVECTRSNKQKKVRKISRYERMLNLYSEANSILKDDIEFREVYEKLKEIKADKFQSDKYYLYFSQMGKCMYSGEAIDFNDLSKPEKYDIDHIIPRSMVKDDSLDNRVLVKQNLNKSKSDSYPIPQSILFNSDYKKAYSFYKKLKDAKLISEEKYSRLTRLELTESDLASFVNRQLVYTNQAVKGFINAIKYFKTTDDFSPTIVYSKGENVSDFRRAFGIVKCRSVNNFHHAHDAYLNIVVGRTIDTYFKPYHQNKSTLKQMHDEGKTTDTLNIFFQNKESNKPCIFDEKGNLVWAYHKSIRKVKQNIFKRFDILTTTRAYIGTEMFSKATIYPKGIGNIPVKMYIPYNNTNNYGGLKEYSFGLYSLIKVKDDYILEAIPTIYRNAKEKYLDGKYLDYELIIPEIKNNVIIESDKRKYCITGKSGKQFLLINKKERIFSKEEIIIVKKIEKLIDKLAQKRIEIKGHETIDDIVKRDGFIFNEGKLIISPSSNEKTKEVTLSIAELNSIYNTYIRLLKKDIYNFSTCVNLSEELIGKRDKYDALSIYGKATIIFNLNLLLKCNERKAIDLSLLELSPNCGVLSMNKKLKNCRIVYESITGYYRKVVFEI